MQMSPTKQYPVRSPFGDLTNCNAVEDTPQDATNQHKQQRDVSQEDDDRELIMKSRHETSHQASGRI